MQGAAGDNGMIMPFTLENHTQALPKQHASKRKPLDLGRSQPAMPSCECARVRSLPRLSSSALLSLLVRSSFAPHSLMSEPAANQQRVRSESTADLRRISSEPTATTDMQAPTGLGGAGFYSALLQLYFNWKNGA